jgi:hypothetical protein
MNDPYNLQLEGWLDRLKAGVSGVSTNASNLAKGVSSMAAGTTPNLQNTKSVKIHSIFKPIKQRISKLVPKLTSNDPLVKLDASSKIQIELINFIKDSMKVGGIAKPNDLINLIISDTSYNDISKTLTDLRSKNVFTHSQPSKQPTTASKPKSTSKKAALTQNTSKTPIPAARSTSAQKPTARVSSPSIIVKKATIRGVDYEYLTGPVINGWCIAPVGNALRKPLTKKQSSAIDNYVKHNPNVLITPPTASGSAPIVPQKAIHIPTASAPASGSASVATKPTVPKKKTAKTIPETTKLTYKQFFVE